MVLPHGLVIINIPPRDTRGHRGYEALTELLALMQKRFPDATWASGERLTRWYPDSPVSFLQVHNNGVPGTMLNPGHPKISYASRMVIGWVNGETPITYDDMMEQLRGGYNEQ